MEIFSVAALGVAGALMAVMIKGTRPELAILVSLATGTVILFKIFDGLGSAMTQFYSIVEKSGINVKYFEVAIKACVIAYVTQFASELCKDANEGAIAVKLELFGKISIVILSMPVISGFLSSIASLLDRI